MARKAKTAEQTDTVIFDTPQGEVPSTELVFNLDAYKATLEQLGATIAAGDKKIVSGTTMKAKAYVDLGNTYARIKADWVKAGKPGKLSTIQKDLGVSAADWSRFTRLAEWAQENSDTLDAAEPMDRATAILQQLAELRSMGKAQTASRAEKPAKAAKEVDEFETDGDVDVEAAAAEAIEHTYLEIVSKFGLTPAPREAKWLREQLAKLTML